MRVVLRYPRGTCDRLVRLAAVRIAKRDFRMTTIYVGNLPFNATEQDVQDAVRASRQGGIGQAHQRSGNRQAARLRFRRDVAERGPGRDPGPERLSDERPGATGQRGPGARPARHGKAAVRSDAETPARHTLFDTNPAPAGFFLAGAALQNRRGDASVEQASPAPLAVACLLAAAGALISRLRDAPAAGRATANALDRILAGSQRTRGGPQPRPVSPSQGDPALLRHPAGQRRLGGVAGVRLVHRDHRAAGARPRAATIAGVIAPDPGSRFLQARCADYPPAARLQARSLWRASKVVTFPLDGSDVRAARIGGHGAELPQSPRTGWRSGTRSRRSPPSIARWSRAGCSGWWTTAAIRRCHRTRRPRVAMSARTTPSGRSRRPGFRLVAKSEVNANPKDTKDYQPGVWTLPPDYRLGDDDRAKYAAIGESDRFTLKFVKPSK